MSTVYVGIDPGAKDKLAWAILSPGHSKRLIVGGSVNIDVLKDVLISHVRDGRQIIIGLEAPMWIPTMGYPSMWKERFKEEKGGYQWYTPAPASVRVMGEQIVTQLLSDIATSCHNLTIHVIPPHSLVRHRLTCTISFVEGFFTSRVGKREAKQLFHKISNRICYKKSNGKCCMIPNRKCRNTPSKDDVYYDAIGIAYALWSLHTEKRINLQGALFRGYDLAPRNIAQNGPWSSLCHNSVNNLNKINSFNGISISTSTPAPYATVTLRRIRCKVPVSRGRHCRTMKLCCYRRGSGSVCP